MSCCNPLTRTINQAEHPALSLQGMDIIMTMIYEIDDDDDGDNDLMPAHQCGHSC